MKQRELGTTGRFVNEVGYGEMSLSIRSNRLSEAEAIHFLQQAVDDYGVELIDTADSYCLSDDEKHHGERLIARAMNGSRRDRVVVATKGGFTRPEGRWIPDGSPQHLRSSCEGSLRALDSECIDLYQFHTVDPKVPIEESLGCLKDLQAEGKVRWIGLSNVNVAHVQQAQLVCDIVSVQNPLNFAAQTSDRLAVVDYCAEHKISYLAYAPLGGHRSNGRIYDYAQWLSKNVHPSASAVSVALAWLLHRSPTIIPIPASTSIHHLRENMEAAHLIIPDEAMQALRNPQSWFERYHSARHARDLDMAVDALNECLKLHPQEFHAHYDKACMLVQLQRVDEALDALTLAVRCGLNDAAHIRQDKDLQPLHSDPRFEELLGTIPQPTA